MVRLATFNIENLLMRFDFSGFRNEARQDRAMRLLEIADQADYERLEQARIIASTDDMRQLSALALAAADGDIVCLQEVESLAALEAFESGYLFRMMGAGYRRKVLVEGNDGRGIDVALMVRDETRAGEPIVIGDIRSHAELTFRQAGLFNPELAETEKADDRIFRRDCLEVDLLIGGKPLTLYLVHLKSMTTPRNGMDGRTATMALRRAELAAVRQIIEARFGAGMASATFAICGDMNDYQEKLDITGDFRRGYRFAHAAVQGSALDVLTAGDFVVNAVARRPQDDRWTLYHARGPEEQHLCQLDYIWLSPALARANPDAVPDIIRNGQPWRTPFPPGQEVKRWPRTGWDRPKASDHCPVAIDLSLP